MTKEQFLVGWMLLTAQPWGRFYRANESQAAIQLELYYKHVNRANPKVWRQVCEHYAQGEKWPSLNELKLSLVNSRGYAQDGAKIIPHEERAQIEYIPDNIKEFLRKRKGRQHGNPQ